MMTTISINGCLEAAFDVSSYQSEANCSMRTYLVMVSFRHPSSTTQGRFQADGVFVYSKFLPDESVVGRFEAPLPKPRTRNTAATLWLAAGEAPECIARQLGHTSAEMLFRTYSRYVPNLTRRDGSAFERLLASRFGSGHFQSPAPGAAHATVAANEDAAPTAQPPPGTHWPALMQQAA
jgi:hypothetical protein